MENPLPNPKWGENPKFTCCVDCDSMGICCLAACCPCMLYAATKENNQRDSLIPYNPTIFKPSCDCWIFCGILSLSDLLGIPFVPVIFYSQCVDSRYKTCDDCMQWLYCFPCKATQVYKKSVNDPESLSTTMTKAPTSSSGMFRKISKHKHFKI
jgi:hypothetical protein